MVYSLPRHLNEKAPSYRAASWEWSSEDAFYHAPRGIVTQHDGMESHRWKPGTVDAATTLRVLISSVARRYTLHPASMRHVSALSDTLAAFPPLILVFQTTRALIR